MKTIAKKTIKTRIPLMIVGHYGMVRYYYSAFRPGKKEMTDAEDFNTDTTCIVMEERSTQHGIERYIAADYHPGEALMRSYTVKAFDAWEDVLTELCQTEIKNHDERVWTSVLPVWMHFDPINLSKVTRRLLSYELSRVLRKIVPASLCPQDLERVELWNKALDVEKDRLKNETCCPPPRN